MKQPSLLIVGAGAMGMIAGYHFSLAGARITFLVRPGRIDAFAPPQTLYCYDDHSLKTFDGYRVVDNVAALDGEAFDFVISTLDGNTARGAEAATMLRELGAAYRGTDTIFVMGSVGIGIREYYLQTTGLPERQLIGGLLWLMAHQTRAKLPLHPPTDPVLLAQANIGYKHFGNKVGFMVDTHNKPAAKAFAALHNKSGVSSCKVMPAKLFEIFTNSFFPTLAASDISGWPPFAEVVANRELWSLACRAQAEICALPRHGLLGKLMALTMTPGRSAKMQLKLEREVLPLDSQCFHGFHHGDKVRAQDIEALQNCLAEGQRYGKTMPALKELVARLVAKPMPTA